jgi:hypothetical protein
MVQQKLVVEKEKEPQKEEKLNFLSSSTTIKPQFSNPLLLKKRIGAKLFETDRSERKYSCDVELTNDITRKQEKYENQSVISGKQFNYCKSQMLVNQFSKQ